MNEWTWLAIAIVCEVMGTSSLKASNGFTRLFSSISTVLFYGVSFYSLAMSLRTLEIGVAYAIWAGVGTALVAFIGIYYFKESLSMIKIVSLILIIAGVIGLNLTTRAH